MGVFSLTKKMIKVENFEICLVYITLSENGYVFSAPGFFFKERRKEILHRKCGTASPAENYRESNFIQTWKKPRVIGILPKAPK